MSYALSTDARTLSRRGIAVAVIASLALPFHGAHAQLGGLVKKAKDRVVEQQVANQVDKRVKPVASDPGAPPKFDDVTLELSPYDLNKGRIMFRHLPERRPTGAPARPPVRKR